MLVTDSKTIHTVYESRRRQKRETPVSYDDDDDDDDDGDDRLTSTEMPKITSVSTIMLP